MACNCARVTLVFEPQDKKVASFVLCALQLSNTTTSCISLTILRFKICGGKKQIARERERNTNRFNFYVSQVGFKYVLDLSLSLSLFCAHIWRRHLDLDLERNDLDLGFEIEMIFARGIVINLLSVFFTFVCGFCLSFFSSFPTISSNKLKLARARFFKFNSIQSWIESMICGKLRASLVFKSKVKATNLTQVRRDFETNLFLLSSSNLKLSHFFLFAFTCEIWNL